MKLSRLSFALILIGSALLLRGGKNKNTSQPSQERNDRKNTAKHSDEPTDELQPSEAVVYSVAIQPSPEDQQRYQDEKDYWKRQVDTAISLNRITKAGAIVGGVGLLGLLILLCTLLATNRGLKQSREQFVVSQRAHVTLSSKDGTLAEFRNPENPVIRLYFYNSGPSPALNFIVIARHSLSKGEFAYSHVSRYKPKSKPGLIMYGNLGAASIAADSGYAHEIHDISKEQFAQIQKGESPFVIQGVYDYCDIFGRFRSEQFMIRYRTASFDDFVPSPFFSSKAISQISDPPKVWGFKEELITLPRCKHPDEEEQQDTNTASPSSR